MHSLVSRCCALVSQDAARQQCTLSGSAAERRPSLIENGVQDSLSAVHYRPLPSNTVQYKRTNSADKTFSCQDAKQAAPQFPISTDQPSLSGNSIHYPPPPPLPEPSLPSPCSDQRRRFERASNFFQPHLFHAATQTLFALSVTPDQPSETDKRYFRATLFLRHTILGSTMSCICT